jgi:hypothetical protein
MAVKDTFHSKDGITAFVGLLERDTKMIPPCDCEILVNGAVKASLRIGGEMIPKGKGVPDRSIWTSQQIHLASSGIGRGGS